MSKNTTDFFQNTEITGALTPEQAAQLLELSAQGDTSTTLDTDGAPATITAPTQDLPADDGKSDAEDEAKGVLLARDGVHTIPYEKLTEARTSAQQWQAQAEAAQRELQALQAQAQARADTGQAPTQADNLAAAAEAAIDAGADVSIFGDFSEEAMAAGIQKLVQQQVQAHVSKATAPLREQQAQAEVQSHYGAILAAHPDASSIAESAELKAWVEQQPSYAQPALRGVLEGGSAAQVIEVFSDFKRATGKSQPAAAADPRQAARAAIERTPVQPPASLSDIPGGHAGGQSVHERLAGMDGAAMADAMTGMSLAQIDAYLNRRA